MKIKITLLLCCLLLLAACQPQKQPDAGKLVQAKVVQVVSGQTLQVVGLAEQPTLMSQVRLLSIDAQDLQQGPWGDQAKERLETLVGEQSVNLEFDLEAKDQFGRTLAYVWKDEVLLNEQLVKDGYVLFVARAPNHKYDLRLERAQQWARLMGQGIWNSENPMRLTPAEFRSQNR